MEFTKQVFIVAHLLFIFLVQSEATCTTVGSSSANDVYVAKLLKNNIYFGKYNYNNVQPEMCPMLCSNKMGSAYVYDATSKFCSIFWKAKEAIADFTPGSNSTQIWVNVKKQFSINNYYLISVGSPSNSEISVYQNGASPGGAYNLISGGRLVLSTLNTGAAGAIIMDLEGITFNWYTGALAVCGGKQGSAGVNNSVNCFYLPQTTYYQLPPWSPPVTMSQGRQKPILVSVLNMIYIFGGLVPIAAQDVVEILDTSAGTITPLLGSDGLPLKNTNLVNIVSACAVGLDYRNSIFVSGGSSSANGYVATTYLLDITNKVWRTLSNMNVIRYGHACARLTSANSDYIVAIGGMNAQGYLSSVEKFDLKQSSGSWTLMTRTIPSAAFGNNLGSVITTFNETNCDAMLISAWNGYVSVCTDTHVWNYYSVPINGITTKIDKNMFVV